ncbi:MAG: acylphosphatase [Rhodospirillales bacterium]|jgi:acylphosphatase|nr:acylphosphatase [Rhodospirillales bacterium]
MSERDEDVETKAVVARIEGRVQGVWFRGWTVMEARQRGLRGWVRNRSDGSVEAMFAGPKPVVDAMLEACWQGPPAAQVRRVTPSNAVYPQDPGFHALPTY